MRRGVAIKPLEFQGDFQKSRDALVVGLGLLQPRFNLNSARQGYGICRICRDHLSQPVHLAQRHLQHAPYITQNRTGLEGSKGDNLSDAIAAISLLHIADHFFPAFLAEVDIEVGHRHAFWI